MEVNPREIEPQMNFYLSSLEEQLRCELKDSEARLTPSQYEGRVHLIVREDLLADVLDQLQQQREGSSWRREKELMQREVSDLKVQLAEHVPSPPRESEFLKSQLGKISNRLRKAQKDLELQYFVTEDLKVDLEKTKGEKEALNADVETLKTELGEERQMLERSQASHRAQLDEALHRASSQLGKISNRLRKALKDLDLQYFMTEDLRVDLEKTKGEKEALKHNVESLKTELRKERQMLTVSKTNVELELESYLVMERARAHDLKEKLSEMEEALQKQDEGKTILERSQASLRAQLEMQDKDSKDLMAALESERVLWQQEKSSLLEERERTRASWEDQRDQQSFGSDCLLAALKKAEQQLESQLQQWKEDKSSLLQATERLRLSQQEKVQEWERTESTLRSQLEDLESQIMEKPKKKKRWYRKLFSG
ncbi:cingulin-like [Perca flavescens]|uniref:cingulin-like n=1 Tax=Perca flavescens TaxID=8167 RepID=UPI00106E1B31|nr:cingulin-like [Perca flavescens]